MSVKSYKAGIQLRPHFNSSEFMCKCGCKQIKVDDRLLDMLESLFSNLNAKSIIITSGYRCPKYDKKVGGFVGKHAEGKAADIKVKGQDGNWVSTKLISCIAQDLFADKGAGIANINSTYTAIHIDSRIGSVYRGNELVSNNSVTKDFHAYYGIPKTSVEQAQSDTVYQGLDYSDVFDANYYYRNYSDLRNALGNDKKALFNHFINYGMKEGRQAKSNFNVTAYKNRYIDLRNAFGNDLPAYYRHYIVYGKNEGRTAI